MVLRQCQHTWHVFIFVFTSETFLSFVCREKNYLNGLFLFKWAKPLERYYSVGYPVMHLIHIKPKNEPHLPSQHKNVLYLKIQSENIYGIVTKNNLVSVNVRRINLSKHLYAFHLCDSQQNKQHFRFTVTSKIDNCCRTQACSVEEETAAFKDHSITVGNRNEDLAIK